MTVVDLCALVIEWWAASLFLFVRLLDDHSFSFFFSYRGRSGVVTETPRFRKGSSLCLRRRET